jgi:hypothetical protein
MDLSCFGLIILPSLLLLLLGLVIKNEVHVNKIPKISRCSAYNIKTNCSIVCPTSFKSKCIKDEYDGYSFCYCEEDETIKEIRDFENLNTELTELKTKTADFEKLKIDYKKLKDNLVGFTFAPLELSYFNGESQFNEVIKKVMEFELLKTDKTIKKDIDSYIKRLKAGKFGVPKWKQPTVNKKQK